MKTPNALSVKDLKGILKDLPDDMPVILSRDSEGNCFSPVPKEQGYSTDHYYVPDGRVGEIHAWEDVQESKMVDDLNGAEQSWIEKQGELALVLWPSN